MSIWAFRYSCLPRPPPHLGPGGHPWNDYQALAGLLYTTPAAQALWEAHVTFMTAHVNAYTGRRMRDEVRMCSACMHRN